MTEDGKGAERVTFSRGYDVCIMAIDGTWRRDCQLNAISDTDATLTVEGSIQGLNLKEFFLLLSSTGLAYRRCELVRVNGTEMDIQFLRGKHGKKRPGARRSRRDDDRSSGLMRFTVERRSTIRHDRATSVSADHGVGSASSSSAFASGSRTRQRPRRLMR